MIEIFANLPFQECAQVAVPEPSELALRYYKSGNLLWILSQIWQLAIPLLILFTGLSGKMGSLAQKVGRKWYFTIVVYLALFIALYQLLSFPLDYYAGYVRSHAYGLSNQTFERWLGNWGKSLLITFLGAAVFVWIFYLLLRKSPRRWWLYGTFVSTAIILFTVLITPIWIAPLFHQFGPMKNKALEEQILTLANRAGIEGARVMEVDMSADTKTLNAYVTGFGPSKRIVLWDTTINTLTPNEILFVMGHEMGHYVLHHIWWGILFSSLMAFLLFYLTYRTATFLLGKYKRRFRFSHLYEIASLPLLLAVFSFYELLFSPLSLFFTRQIEHNADRFGLEITQDNEAAAHAFIALQQENLAIPRPGPLYIFWRASHPPLGERIDYCNSYCPWKEDRPLKYGKYFHTTQTYNKEP